MGQFNTYNPTNYILDTRSTEYTQQAFTLAFRVFHRMCSMQVTLHNDDNEIE